MMMKEATVNKVPSPNRMTLVTNEMAPTMKKCSSSVDIGE